MRPTLLWRLLTAVLLVAAGDVAAQLSGPLPARLPLVSSDIERGLAQVDALLEAEAWDEAVDAMLRLLDEADTTRLVAETPQHHVSLAQACGQRIARWPPAGLAAYRARVDATARTGVKEAIAERSTRRLARIAQEYFATSHGDDALWALGTLELERGDYDAARRAWMPLSPALRAPDGRPWGIALAGADFAAPEMWQRVEAAIARSTSERLGILHPDPDVEPAEVMARMAVVSIREQNFPRAEVEVALVNRLYPDAEGILAGRKTRLVEGLKLLLASARQWPTPAPSGEWPTFAGSVHRTKEATPLGTLRGEVWSLAANAQEEAPRADLGRPPLAVPQWPAGGISSPMEVVVGEDQIVFFNDSRLMALKPADGSPLFGETGEVFQEESLWPPQGLGNRRVELRNDRQAQLLLRQQIQFQLQGRILFGRTELNTLSAAGARSRMVTLDGNHMFAVVAPGGDALARGGQGATRHLMAFDLDREGKLVLDIRPDGPQWQFSGPPVVHGDLLYVAMREGEGGERLAVAAFSRHTGRMWWRCPVASIGASQGAYHEDLLTLAGDTLYFNTNAGAVVAIDTADGRVQWAHLYQQWDAGDSTRFAGPQRPPSPVLYAQGIVVCLPVDAAGMFALDAASGRPLWFDPEARDFTELLAAADGTLVASGKQLVLTNLLTGQRRFTWPDNRAAGIEGRGRGTVAGKEVFWPTNRGIYALDIPTGRQTRRPLPLDGFGNDGVAVVPSSPYLVVSSHSRLSVFGPQGAPPPPPSEENRPSVSAIPSPDPTMAINP
jgi:hypothetical protein